MSVSVRMDGTIAHDAGDGVRRKEEGWEVMQDIEDLDRCGNDE
jgi:hypothetical protein